MYYQDVRRYFFISQVEVKLPFLARANVLAMKLKARCPVIHTQIKTLLQVLGLSRSLDNAFLGPILERSLEALVKSTAFVDSASTNPHHFQHYM
jgi:hypothetical protein